MAEPVRTLPRHVTTPLLTLITEQALDEDYRRAAGAGRPPEGGRRRLVAAGTIMFIGILVSVAAVQNSRNAAVEDAGRATLISQIEEERSLLQVRQDSVADLTRENQVLAEQLAESSAARQQAQAEVRRLKATTGFLPVTGEGVRIVVDDNPSGIENQQVRDSDLAFLVDGLFEAGAEAIAINDQRLNPLGPIRNSGVAIHVNTRPLTAPYVVRAIGDTRTLQARLANTTHGARFFALADQLGFVVSRQNEDQLSLPAARQRPLHYVREAGTDGPPGIEEGSQ
ncbi:MAG TPA: DUF881 domain-containing protein [Nocardioides sp.]|nr:DUF881 domain-containing protein [Nocardioides sp.]